MTIRRQYSLPNCTLILEGLSDTTAGGGDQLDPRPLMTILVNAECRFMGQPQPISGGRDFFESLVESVNRYAQEFLSHVPHPQLDGAKPPLVQLQQLPDKNLHHLRVGQTAEVLSGVTSDSHSASGTSAGGIDGKNPVQLDLTTVQLFDLVEAIDQFLADQHTLPDLAVPLQPISRRYRKADQSVAQRTAPAAIGVTSLAVAALALFFVPVPEVRPPKPASESNVTETTSPTPDSPGQVTPTPTSSPPSAAELEDELTSTREITNPTELSYLKRYLHRELDQEWDNREGLSQNLEYQVTVGGDGDILGYKPVDDTPIDSAANTPLPELSYIPTEGGTASRETFALFRVVFTPGGVLQISPWQGYQEEPGLGPEITDRRLLRQLNNQLYSTLDERWEGTPLSRRPLNYRVAVTEDGTIADYEPTNQPAWDYVAETPLAELADPEAAGIGSEETGFVPDQPLAQFQVVFKPNGVLEVSPLRGF
ncbi:MAG: DUF4335 domain-containing protein [Coleofasciculus sp. G3-WIS-01]|uniref:DUF4335 domain-containing protein n=1 Tax=Coleofasciculus sp. G3-WIS-01 TaxID=3069528 RepID=UPI003301A085